MTKHQVLERLERAWAALHESYSGLADAQLTQPDVTDHWSVRDIVAHISTWEQEALKMLPLALQGIRPPRYKDLYGGLDAFNARMTEQTQDLSLAEVLQRRDDTHRRLIAYLETVPEEHFTRETRFRRRLRLDTYSHYPLHAQAIREWRERLSP